MLQIRYKMLQIYSQKPPSIATLHKILYVQTTCFLASGTVFYAVPSKKSVNLVRLNTFANLIKFCRLSIYLAYILNENLYKTYILRKTIRLRYR